jgi:hypothetical protein
LPGLINRSFAEFKHTILDAYDMSQQSCMSVSKILKMAQYLVEVKMSGRPIEADVYLAMGDVKSKGE